MQYVLKKLVCFILVICMMIPLVLLPAGAEEDEEKNPEGTFTADAEVQKNENWEDESDKKTSGDTDQDQSETGNTDKTQDESDSEEKEPAEDGEDEEEPPEEDKVYQWERPDDMDRVPLMLQTDYPNVPYGDDSVATSGCAMACIAMVASYLRGEEIWPDEMARRFVHADGSHLQRMEAASTILDLKYTKTFYPWKVVEALKKGKVAIMMVGSASPFTNTQHLVVLSNILPDGKIIVNDPMGRNYTKSELIDGYTYGFDQKDVFVGFQGAWIYDFYEEPEVGPTNYPDVELTPEEKDLLARLIWREARGEPFEGQQAVAEVILNRLISDRFSSQTLTGVIYAENQFLTAKFLDDTVADELQFKAIEKALAGPNILPTNVYYFSRVARNSNIWGQIGKHVFCGAA